MKQYRIFPECNVDTNFVGYLLGGAAMHKSSCNEVVKAVNKSDRFAVGIIDADKRPATMDVGFVEFVQTPKADGVNKHVTMYVHKDGKRFMFTIKPAMDKFILDAAKEQEVDMKELGYAETLEEFTKETKRIQAANDARLRKLFSLIKNNSEIKCLRNTLKYLNCKCYEIDPNVAKQFFEGSLGDNDLIAYLT